MGITFLSSPAAVSYMPNFHSPDSLFAIGRSAYSVGDVAVFDTLNMPYDFSLNAYIYVGNISFTDDNQTSVNESNDSYIYFPLIRQILVPQTTINSSSNSSFSPTSLTFERMYKMICSLIAVRNVCHVFKKF